MSGATQVGGWALRGRSGPVVLVTHVGGAVGSRAAAAALACAASKPERAALLVDLDECRAPRPSLVATAGARDLEKRVAAHMPEAAVASRGQICHLKLPAGPAGIGQVAAASPLARESAAVILLPPSLLQPLLEEPRVQPAAALLRADLSEDRALAALAARDLMTRGLRVVVLKRPLGWSAGRWALFGAFPAGAAFPVRLRDRLLGGDDNKLRKCYDGKDEAKGEKGAFSAQEGQEPASTRWQVAAARDQRRSSR
ncbi:MAG TPA: hypothetical protein VFM94_09545 [Solirubrobacterales bacterium]|nr:hypothetical protein [Solirubrobacterales bacterium]